MRQKRIFYLIPNMKVDFYFKSFIKSVVKLNFQYIGELLAGANRPCGGIKLCYQHCEVLNTLGFDAKPLLLGDFKITWFEYKVKPVMIKEIGYWLDKDDIVVCPEAVPYEGLKFKKAKKVMFVMNWIGVTNKMNFLHPEDYGKNYLEMGYDKILSLSQYITQFLRENGKGEAFTIAAGIDHAKFICKLELKEKDRILYLTRKNYQDAKKIIAIVRKQIPYARFIKVDNLTEKKIIQEYQKADIFLATGYPEGFGLPPLEAMACGCAVVGFTGKGADEYMLDGETAMVAKDGDYETAAIKLIELIKNRNLKEKIRANGIAKAKEYTLDRMKNGLGSFFNNFCAEKE